MYCIHIQKGYRAQGERDYHSIGITAHAIYELDHTLVDVMLESHINDVRSKYPDIESRGSSYILPPADWNRIVKQTKK